MLQLRYAPPATARIYRIPRGKAALVTQAIKRLATNPYRPPGEPVAERLNTYRIEVEEYSTVYEVFDEQSLVVILSIE